MMLVAEHVSQFFGERRALADVSFAIGKGEIVGFLGGNGAGKSTTMRLLTGFFAPTRGSVSVGGADPRLASTRALLGYLPEGNPLPARMRVREYLSFRARLKGLRGKAAAAAVREKTDDCGLGDSRNRLIGQLSKGMRQRVGLAEAMLANPGALILDEPTAGLDPRQAAETRALVRRLGEGTTVLLSSHILSDIEELCARVLVLRGGSIVADGSLEAVCAEHVGERTILVETAAAAPEAEMIRAFQSVPGVRAAAAAREEGAPGGPAFRLTVPAGADPRRDVAELCVRRGWLVTEMRPEPIRLEDIFRKLT